MKVAIASDHGGFKHKQFLIKTGLKNVEFIDLGCFSEGEKVDYPDYAEKVCEKILNKEAIFGIMIDGAGPGSSIAANKVAGIKAALCNDLYTAWNARAHNNANMLVMGSMVIGEGKCLKITESFLNTPFEGGRHLNRVNKIDEIEKKYFFKNDNLLNIEKIVRGVVEKILTNTPFFGKGDSVIESKQEYDIFDQKVLTEEFLKKNNVKNIKIMPYTIILPLASDYIKANKIIVEVIRNG
ncbi:MAG: ribose 5-phosphate isomerase B [Candidatus Muiribacteriota bacterium]|jgi:ribose 5-phosphate isomerase B